MGVNTPPAKASGFELRLKAELIDRAADCSLSQNWERVRVQDSTSVWLTPHPNLLPSRGEGVKINMPPKGVGC